ncbi:MAG TPA: DUF1549 and DUF1553 domain-containing protein [Bryobacteraceae bacterium]|nr:DUF1549 and DUF1553 domain-containing protein [Bryobacteraceae bacterium]
MRLVLGLCAIAFNAFGAGPDFLPIFAAKCQKCHPASVLTTARSALVSRVTSTKPGFRMPMGGQPLSAAEVTTLRRWIQAGAKGAPETHWAFLPVKRPAGAKTTIDSLVRARLKKEGLRPSPEAPKTTLLRRVSLDLTGLPPTPEEVDAFLKDTQPGAYARVVDRLLASPHYGEKWARHWLDLARYADSDGYEKDLSRPFAWRYRNWVINALNKDMPFDQFTIEQLAGDLLPNATVEQRVATGFHRNVLTNREAGVDRAEARMEQDINRTNTISTVWLGLTVGCAQCHNHKFDPISQKEFKALFAFSSSIEEDDIDAPMPNEVEPYKKALPEYESKLAALLAEYDIASHQTVWEQKVKEAVENPGKDVEWDFIVTEFRASTDNATKLLYIDPEKRTRQQRLRMLAASLRNMGQYVAKIPGREDQLKELRRKLNELHATLPPYTQAMAIAVNTSAPKPEVEPGVPAILTKTSPKDRLAFARWLVGPENPLTSRVIVNRMWQEFFGRGIVRTSEDFGTQGDRPTNPALLDWLAAEFRDGGWSNKRMHRLIVTSATYKQSSNVRKDVQGRDPENALLSRQSRLRAPAELVRDSALATSGLLDAEIGGKSVRPPQPAGVAELGYSNSVKWVESKGPDRYRRGLYIHFQRTAPYPMLMNFDAPDSNVACSRRSRSNTPLQALNLLNDPVFFEAAEAFAGRVEKQEAGQRISYAYKLALGREPNVREQERLAKFVDEQGWVAAARVLMNLDEFIVRE